MIEISRATINFVASKTLPTAEALDLDFAPWEFDLDNACFDVYDIIAGTCTRHANAAMQLDYSVPESFDLIGSDPQNRAAIDEEELPANKLVMADYLLIGYMLAPALGAAMKQCPNLSELSAYIVGDGTGVPSGQKDNVGTAYRLLYQAMDKVNNTFAVHRDNVFELIEIALYHVYPTDKPLPEEIAARLSKLTSDLDSEYLPPATSARSPLYNTSDFKAHDDYY